MYLRLNILPLQFESVSIQFNIVFDLTFFYLFKCIQESGRREEGKGGKGRDGQHG